MTKEYKAKSLREAFTIAKSLGYENGMATNPVIVNRECEKVKIIRKSANPNHPEIFLIIALPNDGYKEPSIHNLQDNIKDALDIYGDINIKFKTRDRSMGTYDCVFNVDLF